jgi:SynChlorMet cassette radical SAM/SPASM protein ScmF
MDKNEKNITYIRDQRKITPLKLIYFYLTQGCNLACRHCWIAPNFDPDGDKYPFLPIDLFETAIREAKPLGLETVKLTGGEPLLHPHIITLLEIIRRENLGLLMETNGILCSPKIAEEISKSPNRHISISIDGANAETHDWIRGVPGSFEKAKDAVRNLVSCGTRPQIIMTIMRKNADQMMDLIQMAEKLGASSVKFNIVMPTARGKELLEKGEDLSVSELMSLNEMVNEAALTTKLKLYFSIPIAFQSLSSMFNGDFRGICQIRNILAVLATGQYALCGIGVNVPGLVFGKVEEDKLQKLWQENATICEIREGLPGRLTGVCSRCLMKDICLGDCIAQSYYSTGSLWAPQQFCDQACKAGLFPSSRLL